MHLNTAIYLKIKNATALTIGSRIFYKGKQGREDVPAWPPPAQQHWHCKEPEDCSQNHMITSKGALPDKDLRGREELSASKVRGP